MWGRDISVPDVISYNVAITACAKSGKWKQALRFDDVVVRRLENEQYRLAPELLDFLARNTERMLAKFPLQAACRNAEAGHHPGRGNFH